MSHLTILNFNMEISSGIHSGYSVELAKLLKPNDARGKSSVNLETRDEEGNLKPSFLASSVKGVFRTASAYLLEKINRELEHTNEQNMSCDFLIAPGHWDRDNICLVCQVYGGPFREWRDADQATDALKARHVKSGISFSFKDEDAIHTNTTTPSNYEFANVTIRKNDEDEETRNRAAREKELKIFGMNTEEIDKNLTIKILPSDEFKIALLCLTSDLISSGFFRFGRFTSRGYGIVRLIPQNYLISNIGNFLSTNSPSFTETNTISGYEMAATILQQDPIDVIVNKIENYA